MHPLAAADPGPVGVYLPTFPQGGGDPWPAVLDTARQAEAAGAGALWVADHLFWGQPCLEALTVVAAAATATRRPVVGTAVLQGPLRGTAALAKAAASLQGLAAGRLVLGLGVGSHPDEYAAAGLEDYRRRGAVLDAQLEDLARLWRPGDHRYEQRPAPAPVPIWFGGDGAHVRRRLVRWGTGWISAFLRPKALAEERAHLRADLEAAGRDPDEITVAAVVPVFSPEGTLDVAEPLEHLARMYGLDRRLFLGHLAAGEPSACVERALRFRDAGADHLALVVPADDPRPHLERVLPALLDAVGGGAAPAGPRPGPG